MVALIQADLLKTRKRLMGWVIFSIGLVLITIIMIVMAFQPGTAQDAGMTMRFPNGLLFGPQIFAQSLGTFLAIIFSASLVGNEYGYDMWKNLLIRYSERTFFIVSKWVTLVLTITLGMLGMAFWSQILGLVTGMGSQGEVLNLTTIVLEIGLHTLLLIAIGSIALLGTVVLRSTVAGIIIGIMWTMLDGIAAAVPFVPEVLKLYLFSPIQTNLLAHIHSQPTMVSAAWSLFILGSYLVVPVALAALIFRQRDVT